MRKYYLEIESYRADNSISTLRIIYQATKNRREEFAKTLVNLKIDFFLIPADFYRQLSLAGDLGEAQLKLTTLTIKSLLEDKNGKKNHQQS